MVSSWRLGGYSSISTQLSSQAQLSQYRVRSVLFGDWEHFSQLPETLESLPEALEELSRRLEELSEAFEELSRRLEELSEAFEDLA